jgi:hypothetical protein
VFCCCAAAGSASSASITEADAAQPASARRIIRIALPALGCTHHFFGALKSTVGGLLIAASFSTANCGFGL